MKKSLLASSGIVLRANIVKPRTVALTMFMGFVGFCFFAQSASVSSTSFSQSQTRPELVLQKGHSLGVNCAVFSPDSNWLASGGADNSVLIWQVSTGRQLRELAGHTGYVRSLAVSSNGKLLASGSNDRSVRVWDIARGSVIHVLSGHSVPIISLSFSSDNLFLASGSIDRTIRIWDLTTGRESKSLVGQAGPVSLLAFDERGSLASVSESEITLWDISTWKERRRIQKHSTRVTAFQFSADGNWMASASSSGSVIVSSTTSDREFRLSTKSSPVLALKFDAASAVVLAFANGGMSSWDYRSGKEKLIVAGDANREQLAFASFDTRREWLASSTGSRITTLQSVVSGEAVRTFESHSIGINSLTFSPDGRWFAAASNDSSVRLWQVATGRELPRLTGHAGYVTTVTFSGDGRSLASGTRSGEIKIWDISSSQLSFNLKANGQGINVVAFSPDGQFLAAGGMNHSVRIWDLNAKTSRVLEGHTAEITSVLFAESGKVLMSAGRDKTIRVWDLVSGQTTRTITNSVEINSLALSNDGQLLAAGTSDRVVKIWDTTSFSLIQDLSGHDSEILSVGFSPSGSVLASTSSDHSVTLWDSKSGQRLHHLKGSSESVNGATFTKDGRWLLSAGDDGTVNVWNSAEGTLAATLISLPNADDWLVATPDGLFDGSPEAWNVMLWRFGGDTFSVLPVESYFNEFYYPGVLADIFADKKPRASKDIVQKDRRLPTIALRRRESFAGPTAQRELDIEIDIADAGSGATDLRLFRNGLLVKTWSGDVLQAAKTRTIQTTIPIVSGENKLSAYAFNGDNIKSIDARVVVNGADNLKRQAAAHLLVIGVAQYANSQYDLKYPVADATEMATQLRVQQEKLGRYHPITTISLTNKEATKKNILLAISRLSGASSGPLDPEAPPVLSSIKPAQPEDAVVIYFSGHGTAFRNHFYLIPHDLGYTGSRDGLNSAGLETILAHSISDEELEKSLQPLDADQLLLLIDACNSGQAVESEEKRRGPMNTRGLAQLAYEKGIYVLTASQSVEVAYEAEALKHSYLAYALLEEGIKIGAADSNRDSKIFLKEWFNYANDRVPQIRRMRLQQRKELVEEVDEQKVQRPRVFYTRDIGASRFLIAQRQN